MTPQATFLIGIGFAGGLGLTVAAYLQKYLRGILIDLCGTQARADFWMAFTNVALVGVPLACALAITPDTAVPAHPVVLQLAGQLKWALAGLIGTVLICGKAIAGFIPHEGSRAPLIK